MCNLVNVSGLEDPNYVMLNYYFLLNYMYCPDYPTNKFYLVIDLQYLGLKCYSLKMLQAQTIVFDVKLLCFIFMNFE